MAYKLSTTKAHNCDLSESFQHYIILALELTLEKIGACSYYHFLDTYVCYMKPLV